ncbi:hypothetical protein ADIS_1816 [Lunatimonas lonarensis]|uniref:Uncharacterized protein n=1 Tax=Lunatimonas lonarensis TaxID=1232681 RepID=R7ZU64_9BACT|nr:hypothetical protein ADIS_1816 [Lunatimonas lonarensis]
MRTNLFFFFWLAKSYLRNLDRGISEAIYEGQNATQLSIHSYTLL